jgi:hypothetical protein
MIHEALSFGIPLAAAAAAAAATAAAVMHLVLLMLLVVLCSRVLVPVFSFVTTFSAGFLAITLASLFYSSFANSIGLLVQPVDNNARRGSSMLVRTVAGICRTHVGACTADKSTVYQYSRLDAHTMAYTSDRLVNQVFVAFGKYHAKLVV